jgi:membrane peptidoglycan carboxypeptidase
VLLKTALIRKKTHSANDWESIDNISVNLQKAVIASEDGSFIHNGFDFRRCKKAYKGNERGRKIKVVVPYRNKQLKMYFYGRVVVTLGKD